MCSFAAMIKNKEIKGDGRVPVLCTANGEFKDPGACPHRKENNTRW